MCDLSDDVIFNIFKFLPLKSLLRFKSVCKSWYTLINNPYFHKLHLDRSSDEDNNFALILGNYRLYSTKFNASIIEAVEIDNIPSTSSDSDQIRILGSCNGSVLLLVTKSNTQLYLLNPYTRNHIELPSDLPSPRQCMRKHVYGFGYDSNTGDYKVIQISFCYINSKKFYDCRTQIYSLRTNSWRWIQDMPYIIHSSKQHPGGKFLNGCVHWLGYHVKAEIYRILAFDIGSEECREVSLPEIDKFILGCTCLDLAVVKGWLGILICNFSDYGPTTGCADIHVMKEYGVKESWCKLYRISEPLMETYGFFCCWRLVGFTKDDRILLQLDEQHLALYNPKRCTGERLEISGIPDSFLKRRFLVEMYEKSMVPLKPISCFGEQAQEKELIRRVEAINLPSSQED